MEDNNTPYRKPDDFNPYAALDAVRGLAAVIKDYLCEGPGTSIRLPRGELAGLLALAELLDENARAFHDYFVDIENRTTLHLPKCEADFEALHVRHARSDEVREARPMYAVR